MKPTTTVWNTIGCLSVTIALLCITKALDAHGAPTSDVGRILADLLARKDELMGYKIIGIETKATFPGSHPLIEALQARPEMRDRLEHMMKKIGGGQTNTLSRIYSFQENALWLESIEKDSSGKPVHKEKMAATKEDFFTSMAFLDVPDSVARHANNLTGEIKKREEGFVAGVPVFLGRGRLGEWLRDASVTTCSRMTGPGGECFELTITNAPSSGAWSNATCRLFLRASNLTPLKWDTYHPNGAIRFSTEIEFGDCGFGLSLCKKATTRSYNNDVLFEQRIWQVVSLELEKPRETPTLMSFFSLGTYISDKRFSRPLTYRLGLRPPTEAEIQRMLTDTNGVAVALYEAATLPVRRSRDFRARQVIFIVGALVILLGGPALAVWLNRAGRVRNDTGAL